VEQTHGDVGAAFVYDSVILESEAVKQTHAEVDGLVNLELPGVVQLLGGGVPCPRWRLWEDASATDF